MTDKPRFVHNAECYELDLGFAIMPNGDVVTSDGLPRGSFDEAGWIKQFGRPISFRKPTDEEQDNWNQGAAEWSRKYGHSVAQLNATGTAEFPLEACITAKKDEVNGGS